MDAYSSNCSITCLATSSDIFSNPFIVFNRATVIFFPYLDFKIYKTDTVYRKQIEKDTLITSVEIRKGIARVHTISPKGIPTIAEYSLQDVKTISIDHQGNTQFKKRKHPKLRKAFKRAGQLLIFVGGVLVGQKIN